MSFLKQVTTLILMVNRADHETPFTQLQFHYKHEMEIRN